MSLAYIVAAAIAGGMALMAGSKDKENQGAAGDGSGGEAKTRDEQFAARTWSLEDQEFLARIITMETRAVESAGPTGVGWVAINRALRDNKQILDVVNAVSWTGSGARAAEYRRALVAGHGFVSGVYHYQSPLDMQGYAAATAMADRLLSGYIPDPVKGAEGYTHPHNFPVSSAAAPGAGWVKSDGRWVPHWNALKSEGGTAEMVTWLGSGRFSREA